MKTFVSKITSMVSMVAKLMIAKLPCKRTVSYDLAIVRYDLLGDFIMRYDSLLEIQKIYKDKRVLLICPTFAESLVKSLPALTEIIYFDLKKMGSLSYTIRLSKQLKKVFSSVVFYPAWERYPQGDVMVSFIKSNHKIGFRGAHITGASRSKIIYDKMYTKLLDFPYKGNEIKAIEFFVQETFNPNYKYGNNKLLFTSSLPFSIKFPYIVVSLSSSMNEKSWSVSSFAELIKTIPEKYTVVLSGAGRGDVDKAKMIIERCISRGNVIDMVNRTTVYELVGLISKSRLLIGNDSAAVHIAAATRVPSICILHGAQFGRILPYPEDSIDKKYRPRVVCYQMDCFYCDYHCKFEERNPFRCLSNVTVEMVSDVVLEMLNN